MQQRTFSRRALLLSALVAFPACRRTGLREEVLRALVEQVLVANTAAVAQSSGQLEDAIARLTDAPAISALHVVRDQWQRALLGWKRAEVFRFGPIAENNAALRTLFWPVRTAALEELLQGSAAIDEASIEAMGVDRRGLFALEYLLYSAETDERVVAAFAAGTRRAALARALAGNVALHAQRAAGSLGNGKKRGEELARGGQESVGRVVLSLIDRVENVSAGRLARVSELAKSGRLVAAELEGGRSGTSQQIALTYLRATEQLYLGVDRGLATLVAARSSTVDQSLRKAFREAIAAVETVNLPLETAVVAEAAKLDSATSVVKKLERVLKTELSSTLGLALTLSSLDDD
ncbi:MAG TPA: imelysin family protein [Polyangiaceae bacterium]|nr:imelysin family protein [Polyangiaceae bacterium]